jgi:tetratricopeptide (TPR) repeat protein
MNEQGRGRRGRGDDGGDRNGRGGRGERRVGRGERAAAGARAGRGGGRPAGARARDTASRPGGRDRSAEQAAYDGPPIPDGVTGRELDRSVSQQLRGLPEKLAARVARHLVAAGLVMDTDPRTAYQHTLAARARAARIAVVREACGEAAYAAGEYAAALSELRAARRMNGSGEYVAVMADCERALGRPGRALTMLSQARAGAAATPDAALAAEMTIVEAGARRDLGEVDAALRTLEGAPLRSRSRESWVARLRYAYADALLAAGRPDDALEWFHRTVAVDGEQVTDAAERAASLEAPEGAATEPGATE